MHERLKQGACMADARGSNRKGRRFVAPQLNLLVLCLIVLHQEHGADERAFKYVKVSIMIVQRGI
jgi:hypothetical protein